MIRNFMRVTFPKVLDILFISSVVGVVIAAFLAGSISSQMYQGFFIPFISLLFPGIVSVVVAFGVIYVLLDIRDALQGKKQE